MTDFTREQMVKGFRYWYQTYFDASYDTKMHNNSDDAVDSGEWKEDLDKEDEKLKKAMQDIECNMAGPTVSKKEQVALKPCPFCGCEVDCKRLEYGAIGGGWIIERNHHADNCIMKDLRFSGMLSKDSLISRWNRRV